MKNKTVKMILAVAVLVVCCGAYAGVKNLRKKRKAVQLFSLHLRMILSLWILWLMIQRRHLKKMMIPG